MRLVVHMGATKTASSFIQRCLFRNEEALARHGVYLPKVGRLDPSYRVVTHHNLGWQLLEDPSFRDASGTWSGLLDEVRVADAEVVLLSSETFARLASDPQRQTELAERLHEVADDVTLVYAVRDPLARINSMFVQTVKALGDPMSFDDYVAESMRSGYYDLEESYRFWYESGPAAFVALRFDEMVAAGPFTSLLDVLGVTIAPEELTTPAEAAEPLPGPVAVEALRVLNVQLRVIDPAFSRRSPVADKVARLAERRGHKLGWYDERYWGWNKKQAEWAAGRLAASNRAFAQAVWGTDWPLSSVAARPQATYNLIEADRVRHHEVHSFVATMTARYVSLASASAPVPAPEGASGPAVSGLTPGSSAAEQADEDDTEDDFVASESIAVRAGTDVIDDSTVLSDEAERAAPMHFRRPQARPGD